MTMLVGCDYGGSLFKIDAGNGTGASIGATGFTSLNALARDASGAIYSIAGRDLIRIDPITGTGTFLVKVQQPHDIRALAFSPAGVLYAISNGGGIGETDVADDLATVNPENGAVAIIGNTGRKAIQGIAFASNGTLYGWDLSFGLLTIHQGTGVATLVDPGVVPGSVVDLQSIAFAPDGKLYGARDKLYSVALGDGTATLIGSGGYSDVRGIEFLEEDRGGFRIPPILRYGWLWVILIGYILITPIGPLCIVCGDPLGDLAVRILGGLTFALGGFGLLSTLFSRER